MLLCVALCYLLLPCITVTFKSKLTLDSWSSRESRIDSRLLRLDSRFLQDSSNRNGLCLQTIIKGLFRVICSLLSMLIDNRWNVFNFEALKTHWNLILTGSRASWNINFHLGLKHWNFIHYIFPISFILPNSDRTQWCFHRPMHPTGTTLGVLLSANSKIHVKGSLCK